jgi:hypothetical protein
MMDSLMHDTPVETCARKGTRHCSEAMGWTGIAGAERASGMATGKSNAVTSTETSAKASAAMAAAAASAMTATPGNCFIGTQDQGCTYERNGSTMVHCYLHPKSGVLPYELLPKAVAGNRVKSGVFWIGSPSS